MRAFSPIVERRQCEFQIFHARVEGNLIFFFIHIHGDFFRFLCTKLCCRVVYTMSEFTSPPPSHCLPYNKTYKSHLSPTPTHPLIACCGYCVRSVMRIFFSYFSSFSSNVNVNIYTRTADTDNVVFSGVERDIQNKNRVLLEALRDGGQTQKPLVCCHRERSFEL